MFAAALAARGVPLEEHLVPSQGVPEDAGDLLIVMGGPMSVNDAPGWMAEETALIQSALHACIPLIGVCLGSQLMANALGAAIRPGAYLEIGKTSVRLTEEGKKDPVFGMFPQAFSAFEWHGEVFDLPQGCVPLAESDGAPVQAFRFGAQAYGLLFHPEIEIDGIQALCRECPSDLNRAQLTAYHVLVGALPHLWLTHQIADCLIGHLLESNH